MGDSCKSIWRPERTFPSNFVVPESQAWLQSRRGLPWGLLLRFTRGITLLAAPGRQPEAPKSTSFKKGVRICRHRAPPLFGALLNLRGLCCVHRCVCRGVHVWGDTGVNPWRRGPHAARGFSTAPARPARAQGRGGARPRWANGRRPPEPDGPMAWRAGRRICMGRV